MGGGQDAEFWEHYDSLEQFNQLGRINELERKLSGKFTKPNALALLKEIGDYFEKYPDEKRFEEKSLTRKRRRKNRLWRAYDILSMYHEDKITNLNELKKRLKPILLLNC